MPPQILGVATGNNRIGSGGFAPATAKNRQSQLWATSIPAGATVPIALPGTQFYITASNGKINIRPSGGSFNAYQQGTGLQLILENAFSGLEVQNPNAFPVVVQMFVGFDDYIDRRLYLNNLNTPLVAFPTYSLASTAPAVGITDISGQGFFDIDGNPWLALQRAAIVISNLDTLATILVQRQGSVIQNGPAIAAVFPLTSWTEPLTGTYSLNVGGGNINALVHEIYQAIPPTVS